MTSLFILLLLTAVVAGNEFERKLMHDLFRVRNYDPTVRPVIDARHPVNVSFQIAIFQLIDINEKKQSVELAVWLRQKWNDYQLTWDPKDYGGVDTVNVNKESVWVPDLVHMNNVIDDNSYGGNFDTLKTRVILYSNGLLAWFAPAVIKGNCHIIVKDFPFDTQDCVMKFSSWTYDMSKLNVLTPTPTADIVNYISSSEWSLKKTKAVRNEVLWNCCPNPYPDITYHFFFERRSLFYILNIVFPIAVITLLTTMVFFLPEGSGERIGLAVTLMLAVTVFMLLVAETTPATSEHIPLVTVYFILCLILMVVMLILLCFVSRLYHRELTDGPMAGWLRKAVLENLSFFVWIRHRDNKVRNEIDDVNNNKPVILKEFDPNDSIQRKSENGNHIVEFDKKDPNKALLTGDEETVYKAEWRIVAMTIDRCLFIFFLSVFVIVTISCFGGTKFVK